MILSVRTINHAAAQEIGFFAKSISKPYGRAMAMPSAWDLIHRDFRFFELYRVEFFDIYRVENIARMKDPDLRNSRIINRGILEIYWKFES